MRRATRMGQLRGITVLLALSGVLFAGAARAADDVPFTINAESIEYDSVRKVYVARGNVRIREGRQSLTADWVMFSSETRHGLASGNVVHMDGPDRMAGDFLQFNIDTLKGFLREAVLTSDESTYTMRAVELRRTGEETYTFEKGAFTTCQCPDGGDPSWEIKADSARLDTEGYAIARNTSLEMFGLPVLWLPWAAYPLKRERSTGFLFPVMNNTNRGGFDVGLPFFWAARHDVGVTLTPQWLQDRGFKGVAEADWVRPSGTKGELFFTILSDESIDRNDPQEPIDELRWAIDSKQDWRLPLGVRGKLDVNYLRDNLFVRDFRDMREHVNHRFVESVGFLERDFFAAGWLQAGAAARFADDLQNPDDVDRDKKLLQRLPEVSVDVVSKPLARLGPVTFVASADADYTYFWQREKASDGNPSLVVGDDLFVDTGIDGVPNFAEQNRAGMTGAPDQHGDNFGTPGGTEGDGSFQEGELLGDRGHRMVLHPRLSAPVRVLDAVEVVPEVGYYSTLYDTDAQGSESRSMVTGRLDLRTRFQKEVSGGILMRPVRHIVEPFFSWGIVQQTRQDDNPLFVPRTAAPQNRIRQLDLDNVTQDPSDRVESFHGFTFGVRNELIGRSLASVQDEETGEVSYLSDRSRLVADVTVAYSYEISGSRLGDIVLDGNWWPWANWTTKFQFAYDPSRNRIEQGTLRFGYWSLHGHNIGFSYRYLRQIPRFFEDFNTDRDRSNDFEEGFDKVNQLRADARWAFTRQWAVTYNVGFTFEKSLFLRNRLGIEFTSECLCWAVRLTADMRRETGFDIGFRYTILGLGANTVRPFAGGGGASAMFRR